jgi:leader peptidase (prepilin peptidase)/N-methyltransferase
MNNPSHLGIADIWRPALAFAALLTLMAVGAWALVPPPDAAVVAASVLLGGTLAVLSAIDVRTYRLPDVLTLPLLIAGLAVAWGLDLAPLWWRVLSAAIGWGLLAGIALLYERARGVAGLGLGDAKLLAAGAAWVGGEGIPTLLLVGAVTALLFAGLGRVFGREIDRMTRLPFGPFLAVGIWCVWLLGPL